jgi:hypothetical protein
LVIKVQKSRVVRGSTTSLSPHLLFPAYAQPFLPSLPPSLLPFLSSPNQQEAKEAEELLRAIQAKGGLNALATMATDRKKQMSSFYDSLEEKYGKEGGGGGGGGRSGGKGKGKKRKEEEEAEEEDIDDEEFERIRASLGKKKKVDAAEGKGRE